MGDVAGAVGTGGAEPGTPTVGRRPRKTTRLYLAPYGRRVVATLIDGVAEMWPVVLGYAVALALPEAVDAYPHSSVGDAVGLLMLAALGFGWLTACALTLTNRVLRQGRTGQSVGKRVMGIAVLEAATRKPTGAGLGLARYLGHLIDAASVIGYLWPLWDPRRQTFADLMCGTIVVTVPRAGR